MIICSNRKKYNHIPLPFLHPFSHFMACLTNFYCSSIKLRESQGERDTEVTVFRVHPHLLPPTPAPSSPSPRGGYEISGNGKKTESAGFSSTIAAGKRFRKMKMIDLQQSETHVRLAHILYRVMGEWGKGSALLCCSVLVLFRFCLEPQYCKIIYVCWWNRGRNCLLSI